MKPLESLPWYAVKVRAGSEFRIARLLERKDYHIFLPTWIEPRQYTDRIKKVPAPLFPGYLFSRLDLERRLPLITTPGVDSIVCTAGVPQPLEEADMNAMIKIVESGALAEPWSYFKTGDKVKIQVGPLAGLEGVFLRSRGKDRLILSVHLLQRSVSVEIDSSTLEGRILPKPDTSKGSQLSKSKSVGR